MTGIEFWHINCYLLVISNTVLNIDYKALYEQQLNIIDEFQITVSNLQLQIIQLQKFIFSGKQEKFKSNPNASATQQELFVDDKLAEVVVDKTTIVPSYIKTKTSVRINHKGRNPLPESLRREVTVLEPTEDVSNLTAIGEEVTETLEYQEAEIFVKQIRRPEYIKPNEDATTAKRIIATLPDNGFSKCIAGTGLLTYLAVSKYVDHLPIYRLQQIFKRDKVKIDDATIYNWLKRVCNLLEPLYELHGKTVLSTKYLSADETTIAVLDEEKKGSSHQGYFWAYYDTAKRLVLFKYQKGRAAQYPKEVLSEYKGYLLTDGYEGYSHFDANADVTTHNCWAHARRKFIEAQSFDTTRCEAVLSLIAKLYHIEKEYADSPCDHRLSARQNNAMPILNELHELLNKYNKEALPGTPLYKAIHYTLHRWTKLTVYTQDGNLRIDNNLLENSIRPIAIGRKNYLFAGSHEAAQRSAMFYSFFYTCKEYNINPKHWLKFVLDNIYNYKMKDLQQLLPQNYKEIIN